MLKESVNVGDLVFFNVFELQKPFVDKQVKDEFKEKGVPLYEVSPYVINSEFISTQKIKFIESYRQLMIGKYLGNGILEEMLTGIHIRLIPSLVNLDKYKSRNSGFLLMVNDNLQFDKLCIGNNLYISADISKTEKIEYFKKIYGSLKEYNDTCLLYDELRLYKMNKINALLYLEFKDNDKVKELLNSEHLAKIGVTEFTNKVDDIVQSQINNQIDDNNLKDLLKQIDDFNNNKLVRKLYIQN